MKEEILKELAALKDSIRKIESNCNKSISVLKIETDAVKKEFFDFRQSNKHINYEIGVLLGDILNLQAEVKCIRNYINPEPNNYKDFELSKTKLHFCGIEGFNEMLNNIQKGNVIKAEDVENRLKEENLKLKKAFGEISRMLDDCL